MMLHLKHKCPWKGLPALPQVLVGTKCCHKEDDSETTGTDFLNHSSWRLQCRPQWQSCPLPDVKKEHDFFSYVRYPLCGQRCAALWYSGMYCMSAIMSNRGVSSSGRGEHSHSLGSSFLHSEAAENSTYFTDSNWEEDAPLPAVGSRAQRSHSSLHGEALAEAWGIQGEF